MPCRLDDCCIGSEPFALSLLWPVQDVLEGDKITRDFLPNVSTQDPSRSLRLLAFRKNVENFLLRNSKVVKREIVNNILGVNIIFSDVAISSTATTTTSTTAAATTRTTSTAAATTPTIASKLIEIASNYHSLPEWTAAEENLQIIADDKERVLKVFCDRADHLNISLLSPTKRILLVDNEDDADVLYLIDHTISCPGLTKCILICTFCFYCIDSLFFFSLLLYIL